MDKNCKQVRKQSGELMDFDLDKLRNSLCRSGASAEDIEEIIERIHPHLHNGIKSKTIYQLAYKQLKRLSGTFASRYSLKRALHDLGPAGFYFERWVAKFLEHLGYQTLLNQFIKGDSVTHEADVIAQKDNHLLWIECKFRNTFDAKIPVTTPMYVLSRIKDISTQKYTLFGGVHQFTEGWLVTNVYFTADAIAFGNYHGVKLLSWDYPSNKSIKSLVDQKGLYPVTCLSSLTKKEKDYLLSKNCILVRDIYNNPTILENNSFINKSNISKIMIEVEELIRFSN
jgi:hypothetical protein